MKKFINANIYKSDAREILVEDGKIKEIGNDLSVDNAQIIDLNNKLVCPPYVDAHIHLDYVYTGKDAKADNTSGTLFEAIWKWNEIKSKDTKESVKSRALRAIKDELSHGVQYIRTHIDVTEPNLTAMEAMLELKDELKDIVDIQIVAFPQEGMYAYKGGLELVEEGLKMGADVVGAIPHYEWCREFGEDSVKDAVKLAIKYDKLIDIHCDETDDVMARFVELFNALVLQEDYGKRSTASHTCSFGSADDSYAFRMFKLFEQSKMNFIALPTENAYLQGRHDSYPKRRGMTRVKEFLQKDINVCFGQDSIDDLWYPAGNGNLMNVLDNGIHLAQTMTYEEMDESLDLITYNGAKTLNIEDKYGLEEGKDANFIVLDATNPYDAVRTRAQVLASIRKGEYLFKRHTQYDVELDI